MDAHSRVEVPLPAKGAEGVVLWDACWYDWPRWTGILNDAEMPAIVHPLRKLNGFDAETYPWHVAY